MEALITGALGHIGSRLIREIDASKVIMVDNLSTQRFCSLADLPKDKKYEFFNLNVCTDEIVDLVDSADVVVHLAGKTNAVESESNPDAYISNNIYGTAEVAGACSLVRTPMIYISTTSLYGESGGAVSEDSEVNPKSVYAKTKLAGEYMMRSLVSFDFVILRFGTVFGFSPGMRFHTAVNKWCWQAINGERLTVYKGAGGSYRPYLYLGDAVRAINHVIKKEMFDRDLYNVLSGNYTPEQVIREITDIIPVEYHYTDSPMLNLKSYLTQWDRFHDTGFEPEGDLHIGIKEVIDRFQR